MAAFLVKIFLMDAFAPRSRTLGIMTAFSVNSKLEGMAINVLNAEMASIFSIILATTPATFSIEKLLSHIHLGIMGVNAESLLSVPIMKINMVNFASVQEA